MAENKKSFILYCDQRGIFNKLSDEQAGVLIKHIFAYVSDENPTAEFITELAFESIKQQLKRDLKSWETQQEQRKQAGLRSAEIRKRNATTVERDSTTVDERSISSTVNGTVTVNVNDTVTVNEKKKVKEALPPSPVKLSDRIPDIETFVSFGLEKASANRLNVTETALRMKYEAWKAAGWVNGNGQEVKNWKASLLNTLRHIVETEKGKPKEFETQPEREAREFMENLKAYNIHKNLYGEQSANEKFNFNEPLQPNLNNNRIA
jgi:hypothetical protein